MKKNKQLFLLLILCLCFYLPSKSSTTIKVFQINIWQEGTIVNGGFDAIVDEVKASEADIVLFSEIRNFNKIEFIPKIIKELEARGVKYYGETGPQDVGILSKHPILEQRVNYPKDNKAGSVLKAKIKIKDEILVVYSAHLDYTRYACYLPRGYNGTTWKKMDAPVLDVDAVLEMNRESTRDEAIVGVVEDAKEEIKQGNIIILGGDFNEPSHLDWQADTKDLFDHNGVIVPWDCSLILTQNGFKDTYREKYPNPVTHPGFTFPSDNKDVDISKLAWAPDADERDRIDFIYYVPHPKLKLESVSVVGPSTTIIRGKRAENDSQDTFILPQNVWPTDHKAVLATFKLK